MNKSKQYGATKKNSKEVTKTKKPSIASNK